MRYKILHKPNFCFAFVGSHMECKYLLMGYGIPQHTIPVDSDGNLQTKSFLDRIQTKSAREVETQQVTKKKQTTRAKDSKVITNVILQHDIGEYDVLLGRGISTTYPGNVRLTTAVGMRKAEFDRASRFEKTCIVLSIIDEIKQSKGRFLERKSKGASEWVEVSDARARQCVVHRFSNKAPKVWNPLPMATVESVFQPRQTNDPKRTKYN